MQDVSDATPSTAPALLITAGRSAVGSGGALGGAVASDAERWGSGDASRAALHAKEVVDVWLVPSGAGAAAVTMLLLRPREADNSVPALRMSL